MFRWFLRRLGFRDVVTGTVFLTSQAVGDLETVAFPHLSVWSGSDRWVSDDHGRYDAGSRNRVSARLEGRYARVWDRNRQRLGEDQLKYTGRPSFNWNRALGIHTGRSDFACLMAYYHVTRAHEDFCRLVGRSSLSSIDSDGWLEELQVVINEAPELEQNACWDFGNVRIVYGAGAACANDSLVTYHEYSHAVIDLFTDTLFPTVSPGDAASDKEREAAAVCEALADYLACSLKEHPKVLQGEPDERVLATPHVLQGTGHLHADSLALSSALWKLGDQRKPGRTVVDQWVVEILRRLRTSPQLIRTFGFAEARQMLIDIDRDDPNSRGGYGSLIAEVFHKHGIR